jgi:hypothetical protein
VWAAALWFGGVGALGAQGAQQQPAPRVLRPVPGPVVPPPQYRRAIAAGTRSVDGRPGAAYWRNHASYDMRASLDPATGRVTGAATIRYQNRSPDPLGTLALRLYLNIHRAGAIRNEAQEVTDGVTLRRLTVDGQPVPERTLRAGGTVLNVRIPRDLAPGGTTTLEVEWEETFPQSSSGRVGHSEREVYFVGYWYPKVAVFDDVNGWDADPYLGTAEFYDEFGDYEVALTVPGGWTVMATGNLANPDEVWSAQTRARLAAAAVADTVVTVATAADRAAGGVTAPGDRLTYRFSAREVRDFTWTTSSVQRWDATSARVPDRDGDGREDRVVIHSFWRPDRAPLWRDQARYGKQSIEQHSRYTGLVYPWPHMTSVEGDDIIGGGMEFPMLTLIGSYQGSSPRGLLGVTAHEIGHMWIPMIVGSNEARFAWLDEGTTTFLEDEALATLLRGDQAHDNEREGYLSLARAEAEQPLMTHGDYYEPGPAYGIASYPKPATLLLTLRGLLGTETFERALQSFFAEWAYKHPTPWDLFATFERAADQDLDWFWTAFYYETWVLDQAVAEVTSRGGAPVIVIEDKGYAPMPALVRIQTTLGGTIDRTVPVDTWLTGVTRAEVELPASAGEVTRVEVDPERLFPDARRVDNVWTAR